MNKRRMPWGVMMLCCAAALLLSGSQAVGAVSAIGESQPKIERNGPLFMGTSLGAVAIDGGGAHTCVVTTLGGAQCWGENYYGQLGNNSTTNSLVPVDVSGLTSGVTAIAAGAAHTCALAAGAKCWGYNSSGQLGDGSTTDSHIPVSVSGLTGATAIAAGTAFSCALVSGGQVKCWGDNSNGQLGDGSTTASHVPVSVSGLTGVTAIATGNAFACALTGGTVQCWGDNTYGQLGDGTTVEKHTPVPVTGLSGVIAITAGYSHACALTNAAQVKCWGQNVYGQLGNNSTTDSHTPVLVSGLSGVTAIAAGDSFTCAVASGGAKCWGDNEEGELGNNSLTTSSVPVGVSGLGSGVVRVGAGGLHGCAVLNTGGVKCWGSNEMGQLGNGESISVSAPVDVSGLSSDIIGIGTEYSHSCAVMSGGGAKCWGSNAFGQLGNNSTNYSLTPVDVSGLTSGVAAIAVGTNHACALMSGGGVKCWGSNSSGQLGNGTASDSLTPVDVTGLGSGVTAIAVGGWHSCALLSGGTVKCWGYNHDGELGNGLTTSSSVPVSVTGLTGATAISAGNNHTCAVASSGAKCWGNNYYGQLGNNSTVDSHVPVNVTGLAFGVMAIAAGAEHTCAVASGGAKCWGFNDSGQLGNGSTTGSHIPVNVTGLSVGISKIAAGGYHSCALTSGGGMKCWGWNGYGQVGSSTSANSSTPQDVIGLTSSVSVMDAGEKTTCAVAGPPSGGTAQCWGYNYYGQVGDGHIGFHNTPVDVLGLPGIHPLYLPLVLR